VQAKPVGLPSIRIDKKAIQRIDFWLLGAVIVLEILSLPLIDSATHGVDGHYYLKRQAVMVVVSFVALLIGMFVDYRDLIRLSPWIFAGSILLLALLPFIGKTVGGATRWISLKVFDLQPSELHKVVTIVFTAWLLSSKDRYYDSIWDIIPAYAWTLIPVGLILKQPDLGTAISIIVIVTGVVYFSGAPGKLILTLAGIGLLALLIVFGLYWYAGMPLPIEEHWIDRIVSAFNPEKDPLGLGYQVLQSKIAIGSGGLWGKGLGQGTQNRLDFIPEQHTDFIFSVVGEELGFIGTIGVIALYALILYRCLCIALDSPDSEGMLITGGILTMFLFQVVVNAGMTMGIMPVTGIPLPFLSYGANALIVNSFCVGLVLNVSWKRHKILF